MKKRFISLLLTVFLILPAVVSAGGVLFAPESPFAIFDAERENAIISSKGDIKTDSSKGNILSQSGERYIIKFKDDVSLEEIEKSLDGTDYNLLAESESRLFAVSLENAEFLKEHSAIIEYSEVDLVRNTLSAVNDPEVYSAYEKMGVYNAWDISSGNSDVIVAVLDTGVDRSHEDLKGVKLLAGFDAVSGISGVDVDTSGHGTGVIGLIAATANNGIGIAGVANGVTVLPVRVAYKDTTIYSSDLIKGIRFAADAGAKVINMSIGGYSSSYAEQAAIDYAVSKGCILVAAAGNGGKGTYAGQKSYPASYEGVISVASVDMQGGKSDFSQYNEFVDVACYGEDIKMPFVDADGNSVYRVDSGTSFSCAFVSGIAALAASYIGKDIRFENDEFLALITDSCGTVRDDNLGYGIINAEKILSLAALPIITGVTNNGLYSEGVKIGFNRGTATLDGEDFSDGRTVIANGKHILVVTDGENTKTISFRLDYDPVSYEFYEFPSYAFFEFERGNALLDGFPYKSGERIEKSGVHTFVLTYGDERLEKTVNLRYTLPTVYGVENGKTYNKPIEISVIGDGTATLDGENVYGKTVVYKNGNHVLKLISGNGMITKEISFSLDYQNAQFIENDYANGYAVVDEENGFIGLYGDSLVGIRIYDINSLEKYLHFLPVGKVYGHAVVDTELLLFGEMGVTVIDRTIAKTGMDAVKEVYSFEEINYYTYLQDTVFGFGSGNMYFLDEFGIPALGAELGFDCEKAFYLDGKFYLLAPSADSILRIFDPVTSEIISVDLKIPLADEKIVFGEGYIAVGNCLFDADTGELVLEFDSNHGVKIEKGLLYTADHIIDIATGKTIGAFPFQVSDIVVTDSGNYLFGTEKKAAFITSKTGTVTDFGAAEELTFAFSATDEMNVYHTNGYYKKYFSLASAVSSGNKIFLVFEGKAAVYSFDAETLAEGESVPLRFMPSRINCSNGYVAVCFKNANYVYVADGNDIANGRYISLPDVCGDIAYANRNIYFALNGTLYIYDPESETLQETPIKADEVETSSKGIYTVYNGRVSLFDFSLGLSASAISENGKIIISGDYVSVGKSVYKANNLLSVCTIDAEVLAMKGNYAITSKGIFRLNSGEYVGDTAIKYSAAAVITDNNTVVTFGGGAVSFCSYGDGSDVTLTPKVEGISHGSVYVGSAVISYSNGIGYLDGVPFESGGTVKDLGNHEFILALPCGRNVVIDFYIAAPLSKIEFVSGNRTLSVGESFTLVLKYLPEGASSVKVRFDYDEKGLNIDESGLVTALAAGKYAVKAIAETENAVLEANCVITVRDDLPALPPESGLFIDRNNNYLVGVKSGMTVAELLSLMGTDRKAEVTDKNGNVISSGYLATAYKLVLHGETDEDKDELTIIVGGDTDGDGYLSATDLYCLKRILGGYSYSSEFVRAGDMNQNGSLTDGDYRLLETLLLDETADMAVPGDLHFGNFTVQTVSVIERGEVIDVAIVLSGCKYAKGVFGKINYGSGLELDSFNAEGWDSGFYDYGNGFSFYAYDKNGNYCNTAFKIVLNLRFRVTAQNGEKVTISSEGLNVSLNGDCKKVKFETAEFKVTDSEYGDFNIEIPNAYGFAFSPDIHEYNITIPYNSAIADILVTYNTTQLASVTSRVIPDSGERTVIVRISDSVGTTDYYTINVSREDAPRVDVSCKLSSLEIEGHRFKPVFAPDFYEYMLTVPYDTEKLNIYAVAESELAEVYVGETALSVGKNLIAITVFAPDGESLTYNLTVTREKPPEIDESRGEDESFESTESFENSENSGAPIEVPEKDGFPVWAVVLIISAVAVAAVVIIKMKK